MFFIVECGMLQLLLSGIWFWLRDGRSGVQVDYLSSYVTEWLLREHSRKGKSARKLDLSVACCSNKLEDCSLMFVRCK